MTAVRYALYHGMRSNKTANQIKNEGFCAYGENEKQNIIDALKFFGKQDTINQEGHDGDVIRMHLETIDKPHDGDVIRMHLETIDKPHRKTAWASADKTAACGWWARANPEHVSDSLLHAGVKPKQINEYLNKNTAKTVMLSS